MYTYLLFNLQVLPARSNTTVHCQFTSTDSIVPGIVYSLYCITTYCCSICCSSFVTTRLVSLEDEASARTQGVLDVDG